MGQKSSNVIQSKSQINYSYATIRVTQSRIDKGLIAIPVTLAEWFPDHNENIQVYLDDSPVSQSKHYSSYSSSTRECRIGGVRQWFQNNGIKSGDEIVIQLIDKERLIYRLIPERNFITTTQELQYSFDSADSEQQASEKITTLAQWTHLDKGKVIVNEYYRLINTPPSEVRRHIERSLGRARESVPANLRTVLGDIYKGHCQVCDFWFLKRDKQPYFEIHHLDPLKDHHPQNLLVVCGIYSVKQAVLITKMEGFSKELFI